MRAVGKREIANALLPQFPQQGQHDGRSRGPTKPSTSKPRGSPSYSTRKEANAVARDNGPHDLGAADQHEQPSPNARSGDAAPAVRELQKPAQHGAIRNERKEREQAGDRGPHCGVRHPRRSRTRCPSRNASKSATPACCSPKRARRPLPRSDVTARVRSPMRSRRTRRRPSYSTSPSWYRKEQGGSRSDADERMSDHELASDPAQPRSARPASVLASVTKNPGGRWICQRRRRQRPIIGTF